MLECWIMLRKLKILDYFVDQIMAQLINKSTKKKCGDKMYIKKTYSNNILDFASRSG